MPRTKKTPATPIAGPRLVKEPARKPSAPPAAATVYAQVELRAYSLFVEGGRVHGHDLDHWLAAEQEIIGTRRAG